MHWSCIERCTIDWRRFTTEVRQDRSDRVEQDRVECYNFALFSLFSLNFYSGGTHRSLHSTGDRIQVIWKTRVRMGFKSSDFTNSCYKSMSKYSRIDLNVPFSFRWAFVPCRSSLSLLYLSVSFHTMVKSAVPVSVLIARLCLNPYRSPLSCDSLKLFYVMSLTLCLCNDTAVSFWLYEIFPWKVTMVAVMSMLEW